jgi:hypothetical protein
MLLQGGSQRSGAIAVLVVICLIVIMGAAAFAIDGGVLLVMHRRAQTDADASAWAAAADLLQHYSQNQGLDPYGTGAQSAVTTFQANRSLNSTIFNDSNSSMTATFSPNNYLAGPINEVGKPIPPGYVEVLVTYQQPRYFSKVFGSGTIPVWARSVAAARAVSVGNAISLLSLSAKQALSLTGQGNITTTGAGIVVNSSASNAVSLTGQGTLTAPSLSVVGGTSVTGQGNIQAPVTQSTTTYPDPLANLPAPDPSSLTVRSNSALQITSKEVSQNKMNEFA